MNNLLVRRHLMERVPMKLYPPTPKRSAGSAAGALVKLVVVVALVFVFIGPLLRCAQQLPSMAGHAAAQAVSNTGHAATGALASTWDRFKDWVKSLFHSGEEYWGQLPPAEKLKLVCENLPVEGLDHVCPYFTAPVGAATEAEAAQIHCFLNAAATGPNGSQVTQQVTQACSANKANASAWETCLLGQVQAAGDDISSCQSTSPEQFFAQVRATVKPIACPPGTPESWCTTRQQSAPQANPSPTDTVWTNGPALQCLGYYRTGDRLYPADGCGGLNGMTSTDNATCVANAVSSASQLGAQQVAYCRSKASP